MAKQITVALGEHRFLVETLPGYQALVIHQRLLRHAIPAGAAVVSSLGGLQVLFQEGRSLESALGELRGLSEAALQVLAALPEREFLDLQAELFKKISVITQRGERLSLNDRATFDTVFEQNPESVYSLMWEAIKLNYGRFLERFRSAVQKRIAEQQGPIQFPSDSPTT